MKLHWMLLGLALGGITLPMSAASQNLQNLAARQELEEFMRNTHTRLRDLEEAQQSQQKRIAALEEENRKLRADVLRLSSSNPTAAVDHNIRQLADKIEEVDRKRISDNKRTEETLEGIRRGLSRPTPSTAPTRPPPDSGKPGPRISPDAELFQYVVESGDNLPKIQAKLKAQGVNVTQQAIKDANPKVVWTKLQVNQKILVPVEKKN